jgi:hypothetical protein
MRRAQWSSGLAVVALAVVAILAWSARSAAVEQGAAGLGSDEKSKPAVGKAGPADEPECDGFRDAVIRAYPVADIVVPTGNYPYPANALPTTGRQITLSSLFRGETGRGVVVGGTGGFGGGMGMFSVQPMGTGGQPQMGGQAGEWQPESLRRGEGGSATDTPSLSNVDELIRAIVTLVDPESWADEGGYGEISYFGGLLLVRQIPANHELIQEFLDMIRFEGATAKTAIVDAHWLLLDSDQLAALLDVDSASAHGRSRLPIDPSALSQLAQDVRRYRGRITCFSGQTVHVASGNRRSVVVSAIPVVGSAPAYQPVLAVPNLGVVLEVTPSLLPGADEAILDVYSTVTQWGEPDPPIQIGSRFPAGQQPTGLTGETVETPGGATSITVDRVNIPTQQLATTLRVPLDKPVLVGGLTRDPAGTDSAQPREGDGKQLYLVVQVSAGEAPLVRARAAGAEPGRASQEEPVAVMWGDSVAVAAPRGPRPSALAAYSIPERTWSLYEAPEGVWVTPITSGGVVGLIMNGEAIPELAAFSPKTARWHRQALEKPAAGTVHVNVEDWVAGVHVNGRAYAFSGQTGTWDVTDVDSPVAVEKDKAIARGQGKSAVFSVETGKWTTQQTE